MNSLYQQYGRPNSIKQMMQAVKQAGNPQAMMQSLMQNNPQMQKVMQIVQETAAQNRYDAAMNTQKVLDVLAQNKIEALQQQVNALQLQAATAGVLRYPTGWTYNAGVFPPVTTTTGGTTGA